MPFGEVRIDVGTIGQTDYGYTGQRDYPTIGLMDYRARFYHPVLARFIQPDSIVPSLASPPGLNRYSYVYNNPVNFIDPSGHDPWWCEGRNNETECISGWIQAHVGRSPASTIKTPTQGNSGDSNDEGGNGLIGLSAPTSDIGLPRHTVLHPLDGNVVSQVPIYDFSFNPPRIIGYRIISYAYDNYHVDPWGALSLRYPIPDLEHPVSFTNANIVYTYGVKPIVTGTTNQLAGLGITVTCTPCGGVQVALKIASAVETVNNMVSFDAHLQVHDIHFTKPAIETPFDPYQFHFQQFP